MKTEVLISDGKEYSVRRIRGLARGKPVRTVETSALPRTRVQHLKRLKGADPDSPIILSKRDGALTVIDGQHRLRKARQQGRKRIKYHYLTQAELAQARQPRSTYFCKKCGEWHHKGTKVFRRHPAQADSWG